MGLLLQILGVVSLAVSLIFSIMAFTNGGSKMTAILFLVIGSSLVKIGRDICKSKEKP